VGGTLGKKEKIMALIFAHLAILAFCGLVTTFVMVIYLWCDEKRIRNKDRQLNHKTLNRQNHGISTTTPLARLAGQLQTDQITQTSALPILPPTDSTSTTTSSPAIEIHTHA
jgi:hypothetical protein